MAEKLKALVASTPYDDERTAIKARLAEIDKMVEHMSRMLAVNRSVIIARNCKLSDKIEQVRKAVHLLNGGFEQ